MNRVSARELVYMLLDSLVVSAAILLSYLIRFDFNYSGQNFAYIHYVIIGNIILTISFLYYFKVYKTIWKFASASDYFNIIKGTLFASAGFFIIHHLMINSIAYHYFSRYIVVPRSVSVISFLLITVGIMITRNFVYLYGSSSKKIQPHHRRALIVGAGEAGLLVIKEMLNSISESFPVVIVDDDDRKKGLQIKGIPVEGNRHDIPNLVQRYGIKDIIVAIPSASRLEQAEILQICKTTGCKIKIIPKLHDIIDGKISLNLIKNVEFEDLLGRDPVVVNLPEISGYLQDKVVLVTGAGGSIGSELCRQIGRIHPRKLLLLGHGENSIYDIELELKHKYPDISLETLIVDIQDQESLKNVFRNFKPQVVFHAAAHKHVPLMEKNPLEAIKNNIFGTRNVAEFADKFGVERFVMISTDKAVNPTNVMGATKQAAEFIILSMNEKSKTIFAAVRFGNVLGSRGSVIPIFKKQIANGGPVTVTHPDMIRYFMTIPEAVQLVVQAGAFASGGEIFILDMGKPVKIADLAHDLIRLSGLEPGKDIQVVYTGIRPGEKLFEEILTTDEGATATKHDRIYVGKPSKESYSHLDFALRKLEQLIEKPVENMDVELRRVLAQIAPTYKWDKQEIAAETIKESIRSSMEILATVDEKTNKLGGLNGASK